MFRSNFVCLVKPAILSAGLFATAATAAAEPLKVSVDDQDFEKKGYARIHLEGTLPGADANSVTLRVEKTDNRSQAVVPAFADKRTGLSWGVPTVGSHAEIEPLRVALLNGSAWSAELFDVMGERTLSITLRWTELGKEKSETAQVVVGPGPLARFTRPFEKPLSWFELFKRCNGYAYGGDPATWYPRGPAQGGAHFPGGYDIQSVSGPGNYNKAPAFGAALAAGWPTSERWWIGTVVMSNRARYMNLTNGNPHGTGGMDPNRAQFGVCLKSGFDPRADVTFWTREQAEDFIDQMRERHP